MLPSETMIWQPEFTDKTLSRKPGAVQGICHIHCFSYSTQHHFSQNEPFCTTLTDTICPIPAKLC
ncbi:restriction endonuclease [Escherichia coli]|nr:restriction endonuclease [Escherichia coli]